MRAAVAARWPEARVPLRHPEELRVTAVYVLANLGLILGVALLLYAAPALLQVHPRIAKAVGPLAAAAGLALLGLPLLPFRRVGQLAHVRENGVRVGPDQLPELHAILEPLSRAAGLPEPPELYVWRGESAPSAAISLRGGPKAIVLGPDLFSGLGGELSPRRRELAFVIGHELGRLRLGHCSWWGEALVGYTRHVPFLRAPLLRVQTFSRDRWAAFLSPGGAGALVLLSSGGDLLGLVSPALHLRRSLSPFPRGARLAEMATGVPSVAHRIRALRDAGLLELGGEPGAAG